MPSSLSLGWRWQAVVESASMALVIVEAAATMDVVVEAEVAVVGRGVVSWCPYESAKNE